MDRRQKKTREAIYKAFSCLLREKKYGNITVQDIIDKADIGRSTFYAHFDTKDELLHTMCRDIFSCVFEEDSDNYHACNFPEENGVLKSKLTHILYHLKLNQNDIMDILSSEGKEIFLNYFKRHLNKELNSCIPSPPKDIPFDYALDHIVSSFTETVIWWSKKGMEESPEKIVFYYTSMINI